MTRMSPRGSHARCGRRRAWLALVGLSVLLAGCTSVTVSSRGSSEKVAAPTLTAATADQTALATTIRKAFLADIPTSRLGPVAADAMAAASNPLSSDQEKLLRTCLERASCDTGHGGLTVAFPNDESNPWRSMFRAELTAQALAYPQIKRIVYTNSKDIAGFLANFRSLVAQQVDVIVMDSVYASAILPAVRQARQSGIAVIQTGTPVTGEITQELNSVISPDLCQAFAAGSKTLTDAVGKRSSYALYTGVPGNDNAAMWQPCAQKTLAEAGWTAATSGFTQWTPQGTAEAANALLASGKTVGSIVYDYTPDDFIKPYIAENRTPPAVLSDVVNYSWFHYYKQAKSANLHPVCYVVNSQAAWYGRLGVTAGVMLKAGLPVAKRITPPTPVVSMDSVLDLDNPEIPSSAPLPSLLAPQDIKLALSVS